MAKKKPPATPGITLPRKRFFISYAHGNEDDVSLARWLHDRLTAAQHEAFLDERMKLGTKWKDEIPRSIGDCDVFVVLVSEKSVNSDAVHEEALIARERHRQTGRPLFAPIRVRFSGDLGYVLGMYLRSSQWRDWRSAADSPTLLQELLAMPAGADAPAHTKQAAIDATRAAPRPRTTVDLASVLAPGGAMPLGHPMYIQRQADQEALDRISRPGETLVLLGPRQTGKSSLLNRCLEAGSQRNKHFASVDFALFDKSNFETLPSLLRELAKSLLRELRLSASVDSISGPGDMTWFVEDHIIKAVGGPVVLAIDEVDKVFEKSYRSDFFGMLRVWHNLRAKVRSSWTQVDLLLAISTEPHLLMVDPNQSPFNVSAPIRLKWFELTHTQTLNERYGRPLGPDDIERLHEFLGGHPYLVHLALYEFSRPSAPPLIRFLRDATDQYSVFDEHLRSLMSHLRQRPELKLIEGFQRIVRFGQSPSDDVAYRLQAAGLVRREENRVVPSNELYARFFGRQDV